MMARCSNPAGGHLARRDSQRGMALISALLLLIVVTILALSMFRSYGTQEKIAGNTREKQRATNAAISAQQYAEWWLSTGNAPATAACTDIVGSSVGQVCSNLQADFTVVPWTAGVTYTQFTTNTGNQDLKQEIDATNTNKRGASYFATPVFYITDLGKQTVAAAGGGNPGEVYQINAMGYGGTANAVSVVESTYLVTTNTAKSPDK